MKERPPRYSKVTASGKIRGRPPKNAAFRELRPRTTSRPVPRAPDPDGNNGAQRLKPPVLEYRRNGRGRWDGPVHGETIWIVRAIEGENRPGYAERLALRLGLDLQDVKRRLTRVRRRIRLSRGSCSLSDS